jgi:hypothetical protein
MKGDFSRITFRPERHYRSVLLQQGRVTLDADSNEQAEIQNARQDGTTADVIGPAGRPKGEFAVTIAGGSLSIGAGTLYLDGIPCVNDAACTLTTQPNLPLDSAALTAFPDIATGARTYAVYLRVFERLITMVEDSEIREKALGGADTCVRSQLVWQVRLREIATPAAGATCGSLGNTWKAPFNPGSLTAQTVALAAGSGPCVLPPEAGYRSLENQTYRVEIHRGGPLSSATFKWSRENGSVLTAVVRHSSGVTQTAGPVLFVASTGRDADVGFGINQFVELLDDRLDLRPTFQPLSQTKDVRSAVNEIELQTAASVAVNFANSPKLRRWDQTTGDANGIPVNSPSPITLENGVAVTFAAGDYRPGDYWLIPARTAIDELTGTIDWPVDGTGNFLPQPSRYAEHSCLLTVVNWNGTAFSAITGFDQCVPEFPPLTALQATDVSYTPGCAGLAGAKTVQDALDALCNRNGACTVVVRPGAGWEAPILALPAGSDAEICFPVGAFQVTGAGVTIKNLGQVKITGAGLGTKLANSQGESCIIFRNCAGVTVRDLSAVASVPGTAQIDGTLTFLDCGGVDVESVYLESGDNAQRNSGCLVVRPSKKADTVTTTSSLRVRGCTIIAGQQQYGILGINILRAQIEDNQILCTRPEPVIGVAQVVNDPRAVASLSTLLATKARVVSKATPATKKESVIEAGGQTVAFTSDPRLRASFLGFLQKNPPSATTGAALAKQIGVSAKQFAADPSRWALVPGLQAVGGTFQKKAIVGLRGVCLAGNVLQEARVVNNTIVRFREAVHVGLSHRESQRGAPDIAQSVLVQNNRIETELIPGDEAASARFRAPFAVYVGNVNDLLILENQATVVLNNPDFRAQAAVVVFGFLGQRILIRGNHFDGFHTGAVIQLSQFADLPKSRLWMVSENICAKATLVASGSLNPVLASTINVIA